MCISVAAVEIKDGGTFKLWLPQNQQNSGR